MTTGHNLCPPGKWAWPEVMGMDGEKAARVIEEENRNVDAKVLRVGNTPATMDFRCDRVRVWVNQRNQVIAVPLLG